MLPTIVTPALLRSIRSHPNLPPNSWYYVAGVALSVLNRPDELPKVLNCALDDARDKHRVNKGDVEREQRKVAERLREALLKSTAICGLPKTINALLALKSATQHALQDHPETPTIRATELRDVATAQIMQRGQDFFDQVYGKISQRVMSQMENSGSPDLGLVARLMYGYLLSNTSVLSARETSFVLIAGLVPQDVNPQLKGHLKGALNNGATVEEVSAVRNVTIEICRAAGSTKLPSDKEIAKL